MNLEQVPQTEVLGTTASAARAAQLLNQIILPGRGFSHMEPIYGAEKSGRVLYQQGKRNTVPLRRFLSGIEVMEELQKLGLQSRYHPVYKPQQRKGWSIGKAQVDGMPVAVVWCEWAT